MTKNVPSCSLMLFYSKKKRRKKNPLLCKVSKFLSSKMSYSISENAREVFMEAVKNVKQCL